MKHYVLHSPDGRIQQTASILDTAIAPHVAGLVTLEVGHPVDGRQHRVVGGQVVQGAVEWRSAAVILSEARQTRSDLLAGCDWTQMSDAPLNAAVKAAWAVYRQALRDWPAQPGFPSIESLPVAPGNAG